MKILISGTGDWNENGLVLDERFSSMGDTVLIAIGKEDDGPNGAIATVLVSRGALIRAAEMLAVEYRRDNAGEAE